MQIFLLHFDLVKLRINSKKVNSGIIKDITGIKNYDGSKEKRKELFSKIYKRTYETMKVNVNSISKNDDTVISSTNFNLLLDYLENDDCSWIDEINSKL